MPILEAAQKGDVEEVKGELEKGVDVQTSNAVTRPASPRPLMSYRACSRVTEGGRREGCLSLLFLTHPLHMRRRTGSQRCIWRRRKRTRLWWSCCLHMMLM